MKNLRSIVFLILITPLISFSQSFQIDKTDQEPSVNVSNKVNDNWRNWRF